MSVHQSIRRAYDEIWNDMMKPRTIFFNFINYLLLRNCTVVEFYVAISGLHKLRVRVERCTRGAALACVCWCLQHHPLPRRSSAEPPTAPYHRPLRLGHHLVPNPVPPTTISTRADSSVPAVAVVAVSTAASPLTLTLALLLLSFRRLAAS